jgi:hypothetical protein
MTIKLRTYAELTLREKITQCRYMKRLKWSSREIKDTLGVSQYFIDSVMSPRNQLVPLEEIEKLFKCGKDY